MKSLKSIKKQAEVLKAQVADMELNLQGCEVDFAHNPNKETWEALEQARECYCKKFYEYESCISYINNYDFYHQCWEEEQDNAAMRKMYMTA